MATRVHSKEVCWTRITEYSLLVTRVRLVLPTPSFFELIKVILFAVALIHIRKCQISPTCRGGKGSIWLLVHIKREGAETFCFVKPGIFLPRPTLLLLHCTPLIGLAYGQLFSGEWGLGSDQVPP